MTSRDPVENSAPTGHQITTRSYTEGLRHLRGHSQVYSTLHYVNTAANTRGHGSERSDTLNPKLIPIEGTQVALGGVSRTKVYGLIDDGLLTRVKIGSRAFITSDSIDTYIESLTDGLSSRSSSPPASTPSSQTRLTGSG